MRGLSLVIAAVLFTSMGELAEAENPPSISVTGTAVTFVTPDQMDWQLQIVDVQEKLPGLAEAHSAIVAAAVKYLKEARVKEESIQTSAMNFGINREHENGSYIRRGFIATTKITFRLDDLNRYKELWIGLAQLTGVSIENVGYQYSKRIDVQNDTRVKALEAAQSKAGAMAKVLGSRIGEPLYVSEYPVTDWSRNIIGNNVRETAADQDGQGDALAPGQIPIRIAVSVTFKLVNQQ